MISVLPRYICVHGHFYQPPRENPWLEAIETQESAHPFHDWNERIAEECYTPNVEARVLDEKGRLQDIVNNYEYMSYDFGPTLLSWMEKHSQETYQAILDADAVSRRLRSGHGNAVAQAYNHMIMPLASRRDKVTQVIWGIEDFIKRFGRDPEGMWLPEAAVDRETLEIMAQQGIKYTILAPRQAKRFRASPKSEWVTLNPGTIDPSRPYRCALPHGRSIVLFFYDAPISHSIAFEHLLNSGEDFRSRLLAAFSASRTWPQLVHIATDGESYGHHHRFGEMALAYALEKFRSDSAVSLTNYGEYLEKHPPTAEAEFFENSSWSCVHGVGRWSEDCSCSLSQRPDWNQEWRVPLRRAMDLVRDRCDAIFEEHAFPILADPWDARNAYVRVILQDHSNVDAFLKVHGTRPVKPEERVKILNLLEMERNRMLSYTSCGWFFDDISGLETTQILKYAARALQLAYPFDPRLVNDFRDELSAAVSNVKPQLRGNEIFEQKIMPQIADLAQVAAHVAIDAGFKGASIQERLYCYDIRVKDFSREKSGKRILIIGRVSVTSLVTTETREFMLALLYLGEVDLRCSVEEFPGQEKYEAMKRDVTGMAYRHSSTELVRKLDKYFPERYFSMKDLFAEQRIQIIEAATTAMYEEQAALFESFYEQNKDLARIIVLHEARLPDTFLASASFALNRDFLGELEKLSRGFYPDELVSIQEEARFWKISLDFTAAEKLVRGCIVDLLKQLEKSPEDERSASEIFKFLELGRNLDITLQLGEAQIIFYRTARAIEADPRRQLPPVFVDLADKLAVRLNHFP